MIGTQLFFQHYSTLFSSAMIWLDTLCGHYHIVLKLRVGVFTFWRVLCILAIFLQIKILLFQDFILILFWKQHLLNKTDWQSFSSLFPLLLELFLDTSRLSTVFSYWLVATDAADTSRFALAKLTHRFVFFKFFVLVKSVSSSSSSSSSLPSPILKKIFK